MSPIEYVSAAEAGRRIGVTEKTVRTWIAEGKLSAHHPVKNRLAIPVSEVESIARERGQYQGGEILGLADLARQVEQLRSTVEQQQEEIERLKERQLPAPALPALWSSADYTPLPSERPTRPARRQGAASESSEPLPPGAILARDFARRHGVNEYTFRDHITKGIRGDILSVSERPKAGRARETERYLTPEQQVSVFDFWRRHDVAFTLPNSDQSEE